MSLIQFGVTFYCAINIQMKLEKKPDVELPPAHINPFSKKANLKIPDSPPPEPEKESPHKPGEKNKFEQLMQAACSIK